MADSAEKTETTGGQSAMQELVEIAKTVFYALLIALVLRVLLFQPFTIPSASMVPTLLEGDYIIVSKFSYGYSRHSIPFSPPLFEGRLFGREPDRGDVVVFKLPRDDRTDYIKRLIGLPGDRVQLRDGAIYINGKPMPQEFQGDVSERTDYGLNQAVKRFIETNPEGRQYLVDDWGAGDMDNTDVLIVPEGHYFFMGDNRDNSLDSRAPEAVGVGFVPAENLVGKAQIILLSWDAREASMFKPWTWVLEARPSRFFKVLK
jgi:signal peptidase I